jgi:transglutaminase-like putative cysteine protease
MNEYLEPTPTINYDNEAVKAFALDAASGTSPREQSVSLYYAVRDAIRYDPYSADLTIEGLRASTTLRLGTGWCVAKAILLAACCRSFGIPARLGFADVRNHLSTERLRRHMKNEIFFWHGYTSILIDGNWIKVTPTFNIELCEKFQLKPLEFNGYDDALFHSFDLQGSRHMEYLQYRGEFADVPIDSMRETFEIEYSLNASLNEADFNNDVEQEILARKKSD